MGEGEEVEGKRPVVADSIREYCMDDGYKRRDLVLLSMGYLDYTVYLSSELWRTIRQSVMSRDCNKCRLCDEPADIVHHADYSLDTMQGTTTALLFALCHGCHRKLEFDMTDPKRKLPFATVVRKLRGWLKAKKKGKKKLGGKPSIGLKYKAMWRRKRGR